MDMGLTECASVCLLQSARHRPKQLLTTKATQVW